MSNANTFDPFLCLAWSLGHALLTALVDRTAVNSTLTYDSLRLGGGTRGVQSSDRWVGRCKTCGTAHRVDGVTARGRTGNHEEWVVIAGLRCYRTADQGSHTTALFITCCDSRVKLQRVYDSAKPGKPRHECNAKCLASTGPACECKCGGANHGRGARFAAA